jgi:hypothetical protein
MNSHVRDDLLKKFNVPKRISEYIEKKGQIPVRYLKFLNSQKENLRLKEEFLEISVLISSSTFHSYGNKDKSYSLSHVG